ncbi:hypothetical protein GQ42DRAFT_178757 [Ramicandelaber brevisporus]|nr:hypothetical protein GQ42DRAFT_178757 [Ramicandelaber brevisporus]
MENDSLLPQYAPVGQPPQPQPQPRPVYERVTHFVHGFVPQRVRNSSRGYKLWHSVRIGVAVVLVYYLLFFLFQLALFGWTNYTGGDAKCLSANVLLEGVPTHYSFDNPESNLASLVLSVKGNNFDSDITFVESDNSDSGNNSDDRRTWTIDTVINLTNANDADQFTVTFGTLESGNNSHYYTVERRDARKWPWSKQDCARAQVTVTIPRLDGEIYGRQNFGSLTLNYIKGDLKHKALRGRHFEHLELNTVSGAIFKTRMDADTMQPPPRYARVSTAEVESQFQSTGVSPADAPITTTFYVDIRAAPDATQDEIVEAAVRRFTELMGESEHQAHLDTLFAAFSTLYDLNKRAAYDRYGDALFEKLDISSGASTDHPTLYDRQLHGEDKRSLIYLAMILVPMILGALFGWITGGQAIFDLLSDDIAVLTILPFALPVGYYRHLIILKNTLSTIWTMVFDSHSQLIRSFGIKHLLIQLPDIAISTDEPFGKFSKYAVKVLSNITRIVHNKGLVQPHLVILFQEMRNRATSSGYQPEIYMSKLQDSFGRAMLNADSPLVKSTVVPLACLIYSDFRSARIVESEAKNRTENLRLYNIISDTDKCAE